MKEKCASLAAGMIEEGSVVGLGGGATVALLASKIKEQNKKCTIVSPSDATIKLCESLDLEVRPLELTDHIDIAFDGCDELDEDLSALKSTGGIHLKEKIAASLADDYILMADDSKYGKDLSWSHPICLEVLPEARSLVQASLEKDGIQVTTRTEKTPAGNYLMDAWVHQPADKNSLNEKLDALPGVLGHSLFRDQASKAIVARSDGRVELIEK